MAMTDGRGSRSRVYAADWVYTELGCWRNPPAAQQRFDMYGLLPHPDPAVASGHYHCCVACNGEEDWRTVASHRFGLRTWGTLAKETPP